MVGAEVGVPPVSTPEPPVIKGGSIAKPFGADELDALINRSRVFFAHTGH